MLELYNKQHIALVKVWPGSESEGVSGIEFSIWIAVNSSDGKEVLILSY